jgi:protein gp37
MEEMWFQKLLAQCREQKVRFFFKQWGGVHIKAAGRMVNNRTYDELPILQ